MCFIKMTVNFNISPAQRVFISDMVVSLVLSITRAIFSTTALCSAILPLSTFDPL